MKKWKTEERQMKWIKQALMKSSEQPLVLSLNFVEQKASYLEKLQITGKSA